MSIRRNIRPEIRDLISIAEKTPGWRVEVRVKRAEFFGPGGVLITATLAADDKDLRQTMNKLRRAGMLPQEGNGATVADLVPAPIVGKNYDQMSTDEKAMHVWTVARDFAIAADCEQKMEEGALYYVVKDKSIVDFIRVAFPDVDQYEKGARPNDSGMRPIYDYLRSHALVVRKGQQANPMEGNGICIADSSNPNKVKSEHRTAKATEKRTARPKRPTNGPVSVRRAEVRPAAPEVGMFIRSNGKNMGTKEPFLVTHVADDVVTMRSAVSGSTKQALLSAMGPFEQVHYDPLPAVGTLLRKPNSKTVFEVQGVEDLVLTTRILTNPGNNMVGSHAMIWRDKVRLHNVITRGEFEALRVQNTPSTPEIVRPMPEDEIDATQPLVVETEIEPEPVGDVPVLVPQAPQATTAVEEFIAGLDMLRETAENLAAAQQGVDPVVQAQLAELRREVAYERAQAAHQQARAERAEATLKALRDVIENKAPKDAYPEIVRLVPPFPEEGLTVVS